MELTMNDWEAIYKPVSNHLDDNASFQDEHGVGIMFETYGVELEWVKTQPNENVWTYMDGDEGTWLTAGYHVVNRIGYLVTEVPWETQDTVVSVSSDSDGEN
jgi:hypothetical protein